MCDVTYHHSYQIWGGGRGYVRTTQGVAYATLRASQVGSAIQLFRISLGDVLCLLSPAARSRKKYHIIIVVEPRCIERQLNYCAPSREIVRVVLPLLEVSPSRDGCVRL